MQVLWKRCCRWNQYGGIKQSCLPLPPQTAYGMRENFAAKKSDPFSLLYHTPYRPFVSDAHFRSKVPSKKWNYLSHEINNYFPARKGLGQIMRMKKRKAYQISKCRMLHLEVRNAIYYVAFQLDVLAAILSEGLIFPHVHWLPSAVLVIAIMSISKREVI